VVAAVGHVSGAHVNPAVTLGMAATGKFPWNYAPAYVGAQLVGAVLAALATWLTFGGPARGEARLAGTYPAQGVGDLQAYHELRQCTILGSSPRKFAQIHR
jgi:glycerol uptake facilitator-like aquaporin